VPAITSGSYRDAQRIESRTDRLLFYGQPRMPTFLEGLPLQAGLCGMPMRVSKTIGAAFLLVDLMRHDGDFLLRRFETEIGILGWVGLHRNESFVGFHVPDQSVFLGVVVVSRSVYLAASRAVQKLV